MAVAFAHPAADRRRAVDLETLTVWAIRSQMADRTDTGLHPAEAIAHFGLLHNLPIGAGVYETGISADGCATIANRNELGTDIDGSGAIRGLPPRVHPDAELVAETIARLPGVQRLLVLRHARTTGRPDWLAIRQPLVAKKRPSDARGRYRHVVEDLGWQFTPRRTQIAQRYLLRGQSLFDALGRRRVVEEERGFQFRDLGDGGRQVLVKWCPLEPKHSPAEVWEANRDYVLWHKGMTALLDALPTYRLRSHVVTGFDAPPFPWENIP